MPCAGKDCCEIVWSGAPNANFASDAPANGAIAAQKSATHTRVNFRTAWVRSVAAMASVNTALTLENT